MDRRDKGLMRVLGERAWESSRLHASQNGPRFKPGSQALEEEDLLLLSPALGQPARFPLHAPTDLLPRLAFLAKRPQCPTAAAEPARPYPHVI